jgi:glycosyltransferase involved in cell wall biosynthesis
MKLVIFSCCINEEKTIGKLLERIPKKIKGIDEIKTLVIDDGSSDNTARIAKEHGALVVPNVSQKHLAYSFQVAVDKVLEMEADIAVNIDGDLQFNPAEIPLLVKSILDKKADFVAGDRFTDKETGSKRRPENMPITKYYANKLGTFVVSRLSGQKFSDVTCGFRAYNRKALLSINIGSNYTYTQESFQILAFKKMNIVQVPVNVKYYPGRKSRVVVNFFSFLLSSTLNILRSFRDYAPLSFFGMIGFITFLLSIFISIPPIVHFIRSGNFSPYKSFGIAGIYLFTLSIIIWLFGLLADIFARVLSNQEKILHFLKQIKYNKREKK